MPIESVLHSLSSSKLSEKVQMQMVLQLAPVLKNVKIACMFTIPSGYCKMVCSLLYNTRLRLYCLGRNKGRDIVLVYREEQLQEYLDSEEISAFLEKYGYERTSLKLRLQRLRERMAYFYNRKQGFPDEIGVFLGYPLGDVVGFIENAGKNSCLIGYWKVYTNVDQTRELFGIYDSAREMAVKELISGKNVREIAC